MAIQQHPIPQDISNYRFRLIGDMTIKQFASLGISIVLSVIIYSSPLPFFFKYPISFFFLVLGVGMAFVPVQGRTLDVWILAFIKSIYSPTQYIWKHGLEGATPPTTAPQPTVDPQTATPNAPIVEITTPTVEEIQPSVGAGLAPAQTQPTPDTNTVSNTQTNVLGTEGDLNTQPPQEPQPEPKTEQQPTQNINPVLNIQTNVPLVKGGNEGDLNTQPKPKPESQPDIRDLQPKADPATREKSEISSPPSTLPIPFTPSTPNTLVGLTLTPDGKILDGVMVEIKNQGLTLRATKSNKLGQFLFARPLENGLYQIFAEKEDYNFSEYSIELTGEIMNPLKIQATN